MKDILKTRNRFVLMLFLLTFVFTQCTTGESKLQKQLKIEAATVNTHCPIMLNDIIRLDSVSVLPSDVFRYNHTYLSDASALDTTRFKDSLTTVLMPQLKTMQQKTFFVANNVPIEYSFNDKSNKYICRITIDPEKLKN